MKKRLLLSIPLLLILILLMHYLYPGKADPVLLNTPKEILAHRGVHTNWQKGTYDAMTGCEAVHIFQPTHDYIENTLRSIEAAFDFGATLVEIDIRRTADDYLAIYHDNDLACRTDGQGSIPDHPLAYLKSLDVGFGYTADGGKTFPFRGKGVGLMTTLQEVIRHFPEGRFLIDHKDGQFYTALLLADRLLSLPEAQRSRYYYWGPPKVLDSLQTRLPHMDRLLLSRRMMKQWAKKYLLTLGLGEFPACCRGRVLAMPVKYTRILFGWPHRFMKKVHENGARFYLMVDSREEAEKHKDDPVDGFITDYIEVVGPILKR